MKAVLFFLLLLTSLYAKVDRYEIVKGYYVTKDNVHYTQIMEHDYKALRPYVGGELTYKIVVDTSKIEEDRPLYIKFRDETDAVKSVSVDYEVIDDNILIQLNKNSPKEIYIETTCKTALSMIYFFDILNAFEYKYILPKETFLFGLIYGLMLYAFLNSFIIYMYNQQKTFLYYSLMQLSYLFYLLSLIYLPYFYLITENFGLKINMHLLVILIPMIFSILFNMKFLDTKHKIPRFHKVLQIMLFITLEEMFSHIFLQRLMLFSLINGLLIILPSLLLSAILILIKGKKEAIYYLAGWSILVLGIILSINGINGLSKLYLTNILGPIEAISFSFSLAYKITQVEKSKLEHERMLTQQSKLASMGTMIANISHQWRQPLTNLSYAFMNLKAAHTHDKLTDELFANKSKEINEQLNFMSTTIDDFRNFFIVEKEKKQFNVKEVSLKAQRLLASNFEKSKTEFIFTCRDDLLLTSFKNELSQVIFNILNNALQALHKQNVEMPYIKMNIVEDRKYIKIEISDNAKGIDTKLLDKIFEPYFSTKQNGMGIGLYMSKMIIEEHMLGRLSAKNIDKGVEFTLSLPKDKI